VRWAIGGCPVGRRQCRGRIPSTRALQRARPASLGKAQNRLIPRRLVRADRKTLLLGTALASTLLVASLGAPAPAHAVTNCPPGSGQILINVADDIVCINNNDRSFAGTVIDLTTTGADHSLYLYNSGFLTANAAAAARGIETRTFDAGSPTTIVNVGGIAALPGRLGLRVGTSMQLWTGTTMEPFVIGSLWGNLSDDNQATLVSTGTTFILKDELQDVWGEVSAGVNFFNPSANNKRVRQARRHLRRRYRRRRRQSRHARRLVAGLDVELDKDRHVI